MGRYLGCSGQTDHVGALGDAMEHIYSIFFSTVDILLMIRVTKTVVTVLSAKQHFKDLPVLSLAMTQWNETPCVIATLFIKLLPLNASSKKKVMLLGKFGSEICLVLWLCWR